jgi:hypothetical protein
MRRPLNDVPGLAARRRQYRRQAVWDVSPTQARVVLQLTGPGVSLPYLDFSSSCSVRRTRLVDWGAVSVLAYGFSPFARSVPLLR